MDRLSLLAGAVGWARSAAGISPRAIADEVARGFTIAVIGSPESRDALVRQLTGPGLGPVDREMALSVFRHFDSGPGADLSRALSFRLWAPTGDGDIGGRDHRSVPLKGNVASVMAAMVELRPDLALALARRLPPMRPEVARVLIRETCRTNAQFSLLSALPGVLPVTAPFLPVSSIADAVWLTRNQAVMVMRLAAAFGERPGFNRQIRELLATVATAMGWRTVARQAVAVVPAGVGAGLKAAIAWSGTYAVGKAAVHYYERGRLPLPGEIREFEAEGRETAQLEVEQLRATASENPVGQSVPGADSGDQGSSQAG